MQNTTSTFLRNEWKTQEFLISRRKLLLTYVKLFWLFGYIMKPSHSLFYIREEGKSFFYNTLFSITTRKKE